MLRVYVYRVSFVFIVLGLVVMVGGGYRVV